MTLVQRLLKEKWNIATISVSILLVGFIDFLIIKNYLSQVELQGYALDQLKQDTEKRATAVSYFFSERKNDLRNLATSREVSVFFENKALGMSMEYGLKASLLAISEKLNWLLEERKLGGDRIYARILFLDRDGQLLADTSPVVPGRKPEKDLKRFLTPKNADVAFLSEHCDKSSDVIASIPYFFKNKFAGQIIAWISLETVHQHLIQIEKGASRRVMGVDWGKGHIYLPEGTQSKVLFPTLSHFSNSGTGIPHRFKMTWKDGLEVDMLSIRVPIDKTPSFLVTLLPASEVFGRSAPLTLPFGMGLILLAMVGGIAVALRMNTRNLVLNARLEESSKRKREVEAKNLQLENEINDRQQKEEALRESEEKYRTILENIEDGYFEVDLTGNLTFFNEQGCLLIGCSREEMIGMNYRQYTDEENAKKIFQAFNRVYTMGEPAKGFDWEITRKDGVNRFIEASVSLIKDSSGQPKGFRGIARDITERKRAEEKIQVSLREKEVLLKEIHHRVKNNLQVISSLLNLQSKYIKDLKTQEVLKESQNRVKSMALIHEKLYQSKDLGRINLAEYTQNLISNLFHSYGASTNHIAFTIHADDIFLNIDTAIPCGLILNELVSNSLKHAFLGGSQGEIQVAIRSNYDHHFALVVRDNGVGFPKDLNFRDTESLGLQLINTLVNQLDGSIELDTSEGTAFKIDFAEVRYKERG